MKIKFVEKVVIKLTEKEYVEFVDLLYNYKDCDGYVALRCVLNHKYKKHGKGVIEFQTKDINEVIKEIERYMFMNMLSISNENVNIIVRLGNEIACMWDANADRSY